MPLNPKRYRGCQSDRDHPSLRNPNDIAAVRVIVITPAFQSFETKIDDANDLNRLNIWGLNSVDEMKTKNGDGATFSLRHLK